MSKTPGLARLMERILEHRRNLFEESILRSVKEGLRYREKNGNPVRRAEIERLNGLIRDVGFKFPELWDDSFLSALDAGLHERARRKVAARSEPTEPISPLVHRLRKDEQAHGLLLLALRSVGTNQRRIEEPVRERLHEKAWRSWSKEP